MKLRCVESGDGMVAVTVNGHHVGELLELTETVGDGV